MKLKFSNIHDIGNLERERVAFNATAETDLGFYIVFRARIAGNGVSNRLEESFWFPDKVLKAGDVVVLYTGRGTESLKRMDDGSTMYFYFWNLEKPLWNEDDSVPLLTSLAGWDYYDFHTREVFVKKGSARYESAE